MNEEGLSNVAYFRIDGGSSKLYTQEYVDKKDKEIERLNNIIKEVREYVEEHERFVPSNKLFPDKELKLSAKELSELLEILDKGDE